MNRDGPFLLDGTNGAFQGLDSRRGLSYRLLSTSPHNDDPVFLFVSSGFCSPKEIDATRVPPSFLRSPFVDPGAVPLLAMVLLERIWPLCKSIFFPFVSRLIFIEFCSPPHPWFFLTLYVKAVVLASWGAARNLMVFHIPDFSFSLLAGFPAGACNPPPFFRRAAGVHTSGFFSRCLALSDVFGGVFSNFRDAWVLFCVCFRLGVFRDKYRNWLLCVFCFLSSLLIFGCCFGGVCFVRAVGSFLP